MPPHEIAFREFAIEEEFHADWDKAAMWEYTSRSDEEVVRAYSMANYPGEKGVIMLNVRVAMPPATAPPGTPPGVVSSWIFHLKAGDEVTISGPYGEFFINESEAEMIYIGRGAGMAPVGAISLSHVALPFPLDDPLYGARPPGSDDALHLGHIAFQGERGLLQIPADWLLRLRHNPFYAYLERRSIEWLGATSAD